MVPGVVRRGVEELDVAHAPLQEPTGQEALPAEQVGRRVADPVEASRRGALALDVEGLRGVPLHAEGQLERRDAGVELAVDHAVALVEPVEPADRVELGALRRGIAGGVGEVGDRVVEVADQGPLVGARQEAGAPELGPLEDGGGAHHHEGRQVLVLRPQAVDEPRAEARPREGLLARVHLQGRAGVVDVVGDHRPDHAEVVDVGRQARQELADLGPALAVLPRTSRGRPAGCRSWCARAWASRRGAAGRSSRPASAWGRTGRRATARRACRGRCSASRSGRGEGSGPRTGWPRGRARRPRLATTGPRAGPRAPPGRTRCRPAPGIRAGRVAFVSHMGMVLAGLTAQST